MTESLSMPFYISGVYCEIKNFLLFLCYKSTQQRANQHRGISSRQGADKKQKENMQATLPGGLRDPCQQQTLSW